VTERDYIAKAARQPLEFVVDSTSRSFVLDRAHRYLFDHCALKLQISDDRLVETYNPISSEYAYTILVNETQGKSRVKVKCTSRLPADEDKGAIQNAHVAAYAIATGEMPTRNLTYLHTWEWARDSEVSAAAVVGVLALFALIIYLAAGA